MKPKRNPTNLTMRNLNPLKTRLANIEKRLARLEARLKARQ